MRSLFIHYLVNEKLDRYQQAAFELVGRVKIPEFLPCGLRLIADKETPAKTRAMAMIGLLQVGSKAQLPSLAAHLDDKTEVFMTRFLPDGTVYRTQVRDVALGMSVRLAGERDEDYGLGNRKSGPLRGDVVQLYYYGFANDEVRSKSHERWKEWLKTHPDVPGKTDK